MANQGPKKPTLGASPLAQVSLFWRGQGVKLTTNFSLGELECSCGKCSYTLVDQDHVERLQDLRNRLGVLYKKEIKILIHSAYRCASHNRSVGGALESQHSFGTATDIEAPGVPIRELYLECCKIFDGVGIYDTFVHVDSRGFEARWDFRSVKEKKRGGP